MTRSLLPDGIDGPSAGPRVGATVRRRLSPRWRKAFVLVHVVGSVGWLGVSATFVVLTLALLGSTDASTVRTGYALHELMVTWLARPSALLTLGTGLVLSFGTGWRLTRYWWVSLKLVLLVATVAVTVSRSPELLRYAIEQAGAVGTPAYTAAQHTLVLMACFHVVMIGAAAALSVYKPGSRRTRRS